MKQTILSGIIILFTWVTLNAQELVVKGKMINEKGVDLPSALVDLKGSDNRQVIDAILKNSKVEDDKLVMENGVVNKNEAIPIKVPNGYQGDNSIKIPNHYDPEKDISIKLPNANLEGINKKKIILKLTP